MSNYKIFLKLTAAILTSGIIAAGLNAGPGSCLSFNLKPAYSEALKDDSNIPYDSDEIRINLEIGEAALGSGDLDAAQTAYLQVFKLDAKSYIAVYNLGFIAQMRNDTNGAAAYYRLAARLDTSKHEPLLNLGALLIMQKKYDDALETLNAALKIAPQNIDIKFNIALTQLYSKKFVEAYDSLKTLASGGNDKTGKIKDAEIALKFVAACIELKKYDEALKILNISTASPEILIECEYLKGYIFLKTGKVKESDAALKKAMDLCSRPETSGLVETLKEKITALRKNPASSRIID